MTQIDRYIARATAGLPTRERIDTAAELRVHLNAQVKTHLLEGHNEEEAEFLAVDAIGAVAKVNRQFLGHIFTPRVGWGVLIASCIGFAAWFGIPTWQNRQPEFSSISSDSKPSSLPMTTYTFHPGKGIQGFRWAIVYRGQIIGGQDLVQDKPKRFERVVLNFVAESQFSTRNCTKGGFLINGFTYCAKNYSPFNWDMYYGFRTDRIRANRWIPTYTSVTRAGAQTKDGTTQACVLWVMFVNLDLPHSKNTSPPLVFRPYADYYKDWQP